MNRKLKSTLGLLALLLIIAAAGGIYIFAFQNSKIKKQHARLTELNSQVLDQNALNIQLKDAEYRVTKIDSALAARKYNIPKQINPIKFFNFINNRTYAFDPLSKINMEFVEKKQDKEFSVFTYKVDGSSEFSDFYRLIYAIEQSRELKKIKQFSASSVVVADKDQNPNFFVKFTLNSDVYFADNDKYITSDSLENNLTLGSAYDVFFPLIRNEIPPNIDNLLDAQNAKLLALVPEGAFLIGSNGENYLLLEGDPIYLGYLTKIDYDKKMVQFIVNKGGIIEKVNLYLEQETQKNKR